MTCLLRMTHVSYVTHDVTLLINKMLSKKIVLIKVDHNIDRAVNQLWKQLHGVSERMDTLSINF